MRRDCPSSPFASRYAAPGRTEYEHNLLLATSVHVGRCLYNRSCPLPCSIDRRTSSSCTAVANQDRQRGEGRQHRRGGRFFVAGSRRRRSRGAEMPLQMPEYRPFTTAARNVLMASGRPAPRSPECRSNERRLTHVKCVRCYASGTLRVACAQSISVRTTLQMHSSRTSRVLHTGPASDTSVRRCALHEVSV